MIEPTAFDTWVFEKHQLESRGYAYCDTLGCLAPATKRIAAPDWWNVTSCVKHEQRSRVLYLEDGLVETTI